MARNSWSWILLVVWFAVYALSTIVTGLSLTFAGWPLILGIIALLFVVAAIFGK